MITDTDVKKLKRTFATKKELHKSENRLINVIESVANTIITEIRKELRSEIGSLRTEIAGVLKNHETRITLLEKKDLN